MNIASLPTLRSGLLNLIVSIAVSLSIGTAVAFAAVSKHVSAVAASTERNTALPDAGVVPAPLVQVAFTSMTDQLIVAEVMTASHRVASRTAPRTKVQQSANAISPSAIPPNVIPQVTARLNGRPFTVMM